jgi:hypothetical protein
MLRRLELFLPLCDAQLLKLEVLVRDFELVLCLTKVILGLSEKGEGGVMIGLFRGEGSGVGGVGEGEALFERIFVGDERSTSGDQGGKRKGKRVLSEVSNEGRRRLEAEGRCDKGELSVQPEYG